MIKILVCPGVGCVLTGGVWAKSMRVLNKYPIYTGFLIILFLAAAVFGEDDGQDTSLVRDIEDHLIAPCCWTQPISQHESGVSEQMREEVRTMVASGMSREAIMDHFVARYGERILATPRPEGFNRLVYILPWVALAFGAWLLFVFLKKLRAPASATSDSSEPDNRYASLIEKELKDLEEK